MTVVYPLLTPTLDIVSKFMMKETYKGCCSNLNQRDANILSEGPVFEVADVISNYLNMVFTCIFYSILVPHCIPIGCLASIYYYWIWKYMLLRYNKSPDLMSDILVSFFSDGLPFIGIIWSLFFIYFIEQIKTKIIGEQSYLWDFEPLYDYKLSYE